MQVESEFLHSFQIIPYFHKLTPNSQILISNLLKSFPQQLNSQNSNRLAAAQATRLCLKKIKG